MAALSLAADKLGDISPRLVNNHKALPKPNAIYRNTRSQLNLIPNDDKQSSLILISHDPNAYALPCTDSRMSSDKGYERNLKPNSPYLITYV